MSTDDRPEPYRHPSPGLENAHAHGHEPEHITLGICDDPECRHEIIDEHYQGDLVFDGKCPRCGGAVELGVCSVCAQAVHEHYEMKPPSDGTQGRLCPVCTVGIDRILMCTQRDLVIVLPCQHEVDLNEVFVSA